MNPKTHSLPPLDRGENTPLSPLLIEERKRLPAPPTSPSAQRKPGRRFRFNIGFSSDFYIALSILLLLVTGAGWGQGNGWRWLTGGNLNKVKFIGQTGWIIGDDGNQGIILHTTNGGDTWAIQPHNSGRHYLNGLTFVDSLNGWIVGGSRGMGEPGFMLRTRNGGQTWVEQFNWPGNHLNGVSFVDTLHGWFTAYADTIYRTTNGGIIWQGVQPDTNGWHYGPIDFVDTLRGWAVHPGGIFMVSRTTDGGLTWTTVSDAFLPSLNAIDMADSVNGWTVGEGDAMVRTRDGWRTWQTSPGGPNAILYDVSFGDTLNGWAVGGDNGHNAMIFHSTNGGASWTYDSTLTMNNAFYGVSAVNADTAYAVGSGGGVVRTTNGINWTVIRNTDIGNTSLLNGTFYDANRGWAVGTYGVITHTVNGGTIWRSQASGVSSFLYGVSFADSQYGKICTDGGGVLGTRNGGNTWAGESTGATSPLWSIDYPDTSFAVAVGGYYGPEPPRPGVEGSRDRGFEGREQIPPDPPFSKGGVFRNDTLPLKETSLDCCKRRGRLGGTNPTTAYRTITRTTNGGATWLALNTSGQSPLYGVSFVTPRKGWACGDPQGGMGVILHTTDSGATWQGQNSNVNQGLYWIQFLDSLHGWTVGNAGTALWTTDGGNIWNQGNTGTTLQFLSCAFYDTLGGFACGGNGTLFQTTDGGRNWQADSSKTHANLMTVCALDSTHAWTVGSFGLVLGWGEAGNTGTEERVQGVQGQRVQGTALGQSYPNPTTGIASFEYELGKAGKVRVKVYNVAGQAVRTLVEGIEPAGKHVVTWDGRDSSGRKAGSGTYFYCLEAVDRKAVRKFVIIK